MNFKNPFINCEVCGKSAPRKGSAHKRCSPECFRLARKSLNLAYYQLNRERKIKETMRYQNKYPWKRALWGARSRCTNKRGAYWPIYGGRGILCFLTEIECKQIWDRDKAWTLKRPSLDRIDSDGHYEYGNCRFIELSENLRLGRLNQYHYAIQKKLEPARNDLSSIVYKYCMCHAAIKEELIEKIMGWAYGRTGPKKTIEASSV